MLRILKTYDCDGVLVDTSHRYRNLPNGMIDLQYWKDNAHRLDGDVLLPMARQFAADCANPSIYVILCTAREFNPRDVDFFNSRLGAASKIIMRPIGDNTPDYALKRRALTGLFNLRQFSKLPRFFYEDNKKNIAACKHLFYKSFFIPSRIADND